MGEGDIGAVIDTLIFDNGECYEPDMIHVTGDIYAVAYRAAGTEGRLRSFSIASNGDIGDPRTGSHIFDAADGYTPSIIHIYSDIFAIAFSGVGRDGFVVTVRINADGTIPAGLIDSLEFETVQCLDPHIIHISGDIYAVAYTTSLQDGRVCTFTISAAGDIAAAVIEKATWLPTVMLEPEIIHVDGDIYAIAYKGADDDGYILTLSIDASGDIGGSAIDTFEFATDFCEKPCIVNVASNIFAISFKGPDSDGFLTTVSIANDGNIGAAIIDSFEFDASQGVHSDIIHNSQDVYSIAYTGPDADGFLITVTIASDGAISEPVIDTLEFDTVKAEYCSLLHVTGDTYAIAYGDTNDQGKVASIGIETRFAAPPLHLPLMGIG